MPRLNAGLFRFGGEAGDPRPGVLRDDGVHGESGVEGDVLVLVDDDLREDGLVEESAFSRFALHVEVVQIGQESEHLIESDASVGVAGVEAVESGLDRGQGVVNPVLLGLEEIDRDRVGVVRLYEFQAFGFQLGLLLGERGAFVLGRSLEMVEHIVQDRTCGGCLLCRERFRGVGLLDFAFDALCEYRGTGAGRGAASAPGTGEVVVSFSCLAAGPLEHELRPA